MMFRVHMINVQGTRNTRNPHHHRVVQSVQGVRSIHARVHANASRTHTHLFNSLSRVPTRNTLNTLNKPVIARLSVVQGTLNIKNNTLNMQNNKPLRQIMPTVAAWIDQHRAVFGEADTNAAIRAGIDGQPTFHARENGQVVGTPHPSQKNATAAHRCKQCTHYARPGMSSGYCAARHDLPLAYGPAHPLRKLPADSGADCATFNEM